MAQGGFHFYAFPIIIALSAIGAYSLNEWYCHRMVPQWITSAVTPCTFPCLLISTHEHPQIVVHNEVDGSSCRVTSNPHHKTQVGRCRRGVCAPILVPQVLKRKKRFICLITLARLIQARKERKKLQGQIDQLRQAALLNYLRGDNRGSGVDVGGRNLPGITGGATGHNGASSSSDSTIEIHISPDGGTTGAGVSSRGFHVGSIRGVGTSGNNFHSGFAGRPGDVSRMRGGIHWGNRGFHGDNRATSVGSATTAAGTSIYENIAANGRGLGRSAYDTSGVRGVGGNVVGAGGVLGGGTASTSSVGGGSGAAGTVSISSVGLSARAGSVARNGGSGSLASGAPGSISGGVVGVTGVVSTRTNGNSNSVNLGLGTVGASYASASGLGASGSRGGRRRYPGAVGGSSDGAASRGSDIERGYGLTRLNNRLGTIADGVAGVGPTGEGNGDFNDDTGTFDSGDDFDLESGLNDGHRG